MKDEDRERRNLDRFLGIHQLPPVWWFPRSSAMHSSRGQRYKQHSGPARMPVGYQAGARHDCQAQGAWPEQARHPRQGRDSASHLHDSIRCKPLQGPDVVVIGKQNVLPGGGPVPGFGQQGEVIIKQPRMQERVNVQRHHPQNGRRQQEPNGDTESRGLAAGRVILHGRGCSSPMG